ncbi:hypothetical protein QEP16_10100 [Achromobacter insolitus]|uniref:Uncharacterized protein n=1 Tax=Achromobacter insolitus TaxID=217204 RepID=A0A6S7F6E1_9BURK|nr:MULTISPECIES: hypothetical protein [Achromobacter]GLK92711.1 hypothetical protein GCM10008164_04470 [Achromobacter xylosoxidans]MCP1402325.1 putative membrane protein YgcG [Achromobacter insolitus]MDH3063656.1 hypothetical protein [Achromobacter insolitus]MDQ6214275.1 hypothetical protein [Achromobacter insolitus]MEB3098141.1 hypothetical protein [Achromobacter sp. D10]
MGKLLYTVYAIVVVIFATGFSTPGARMSSGGGSSSSWGSSSSGGSGWSSGGSHK